jgi:hypothetical protein
VSELTGCLRRALLVQVGDGSGITRIGVVAEDRDPAREARSIRRKADQPQADRPRDRVSPQLLQPLDVGVSGRQALARDGAQQLSQEKRVAAALLVAGDTEGVVGIGREQLPDEPAGGRSSERGRPDHRRQRVGHKLAENDRVRPLLRRAECSHERERKVLHARNEVGEPAKRGRVAPVQIIDREQERSSRCNVRGQPVKAV